MRRREFITIIGGGGEDNLTRYDLTPVRGLGCWGWVLASPAEHVTGSVDCTSSVVAHDVHSKLLGQFCDCFGLQLSAAAGYLGVDVAGAEEGHHGSGLTLQS